MRYKSTNSPLYRNETGPKQLQQQGAAGFTTYDTMAV